MGANNKVEATVHGLTPDTQIVEHAYVAYRSSKVALITGHHEFEGWLAQVRAEAKAEALTEAADNLQNHPRLRKTQFAWGLYPEHMAAKEKTFNECADILRDRAQEIKGSK